MKSPAYKHNYGCGGRTPAGAEARRTRLIYHTQQSVRDAIYGYACPYSLPPFNRNYENKRFHTHAQASCFNGRDYSNDGRRTSGPNLTYALPTRK